MMHLAALTMFASLFFAHGAGSKAFDVIRELDNATVIEGQNVTLNCTFSERLPYEFNILWKNATHDLGRCQYPYACRSFIQDSRMTLSEENRQIFLLHLSNSKWTDSQTYKCIFEIRNGSSTHYRVKSTGRISVISERDISSPTCRSLINIAPAVDFVTMQCYWNQTSLYAVGSISYQDGSVSSGNVQGYNGSVISKRKALNDFVDFSKGETCVMNMPGLSSQRSCDFMRRLTPLNYTLREGETATYTCDSPSTEGVSWAVINNGELQSSGRLPPQIMTNTTNLTVKKVPLDFDKMIILCLSTPMSGEPRKIRGVGKLFVSGKRRILPPQEVNLDGTTALDTEAVVTTNAPDLSTSEMLQPAQSSQSEFESEKTPGTHAVKTNFDKLQNDSSLNPVSDPSSIPTLLQLRNLIYYCVAASTLALVLGLFLTIRTCRRKPSTGGKDPEQTKVAKIEGVPAQSNQDYATIDSSEMRSNRSKANEVKNNVERRSSSLRYQPPNPVHPITSDILFEEATPNGYALPSIPKCRTMSECHPSLPLASLSGSHISGPAGTQRLARQHSAMEISPQRVISVDINNDGRGDTDVESTVNSRVSDIRPHKDRDETFYFSVDKTLSDDEEEDDDGTGNDVVLNEMSQLDEDHDYFTLEQSANVAPGREPESIPMTTKTSSNNNVVPHVMEIESGYDNFRFQRIPHKRDKTEIQTNTYHKLQVQTKG
ncbi:uncharacterized protein [Diadema setosum]|uniref:uncharacterized protein n=1 Tax=Diadema setosum TaxID=31175 RepID=UPI003B3B766B